MTDKLTNLTTTFLNFTTATTTVKMVSAKSYCISRGVMRLDGAQGKKQVWRPNVRSWGLSEANVLHWRKYLWHCCTVSAPPQSFSAPIVIRRPG